jgi:bile acid-coenzyme A ligase
MGRGEEHVGHVVSYGTRLTEIAAARPDDADLTIVAANGDETTVTWRTLETRANQIARRFEALGVREGSIVAVALPSSVDHVVSTLAIWKLGATLLPLRHDQPQWEMGRLLAIAQPGVLVSDTHTAACPVLTSTDLAAAHDLPDDRLDDHVSHVMYLGASSGSTGAPKLIEIPFPAVLASDYQARFMGTEEAGAVLVTSPLYHVNGFQFTAPQLLEGARVVVMEKFDAGVAVDLIERHRIALCIMVPTMLQRIVQLPGITAERFTSIRRIIIGGAKTPEWVVDRLLELVPAESLLFVYGSTERLGVVTMTGDAWPEHRGAAGLPQDVDLSIRDHEGNEVAAGEVGEIHMRPLDPTRRLFRYLGSPTPSPTHDGFRTIGDLGWVDEDGYLFIADRRTDLIITGGANVFPAEVEAALSEHPDVVDQVVVPVADAEWGHRVHAIVQPVDLDHPPDPAELRDFCKARIAAYKAPKTFEFVDVLPRTPAGKVNRTALGEARA